MGCSNHDCRKSNEVIVDNTVFNFNLKEVSDNTYDLIVTPCNVPTSVYCVARITKRENCCNNMEYFQSFINTDPVVIIQDCNLCDIISRSIEAYFNNVSTFNSNNCNSCGCGSNSFGLF